jgi:hypothetical protein
LTGNWKLKTKRKWTYPHKGRAASFPSETKVNATVDRLLSHLQGYEGDYVFHVVDESTVVMLRRDEDKRIIAYEFEIRCYSVISEPKAEEPEEVFRRQGKGW